MEIQRALSQPSLSINYTKKRARTIEVLALLNQVGMTKASMWGALWIIPMKWLSCSFCHIFFIIKIIFPHTFFSDVTFKKSWKSFIIDGLFYPTINFCIYLISFDSICANSYADNMIPNWKFICRKVKFQGIEMTVDPRVIRRTLFVNSDL